jgi:hypothetical protein
MATQSCVNRRGLRTHPCGAPVWRIRGVEMFTYPHHLGAASQEFQDPVSQGGVETQGLELNDELGVL